MKPILLYIRSYFLSINRLVFFVALLFVTLAIFINYYFGLNKAINNLPGIQQYSAWALVFLVSFGIIYLVQALIEKKNWFLKNRFVALLVMASLIFAWKMSADFHFDFTPEKRLNIYYNRVVYWPLKVAVVTTLLLFIWKFAKNEESFYGIRLKGFQAKPYWIMLLIMVPLISLAATQPDFQAVYPKLQNIAFLKQKQTGWWYYLVYELSYGSDFFTIELFFRGFLVLAFAKYAGKDAILPMSVFYCTIHFGKPLGECISSFFGGLILGIVTFHTRNILGGLMVHLGIAWLMELAGMIARK